MSQSRFWGAVLVVLGVILGLIFFFITFAAAGTSAGRALGVILVIIIALPLIIGGAFLLVRGQQEAASEKEVAARRRTLESESLSRAELADRLDRQHKRLETVLQAALPESNPTNRLLLEDALTRLDGLTHALRRTSYERVGSFEVMAADESDPETVRSIDAALDSGVRSMEQQVSDLTRSLAEGKPDSGIVSQLSGTISRLENAANERTEVLTSGEQKALPTVAELLRGNQPLGVQDASKFTDLKPNDAVTYDGSDYVISGRLEWSEGATAWYTYLLGGGEQERWLLVEQGGTSISVMQPIRMPDDATGESISVQGGTWNIGSRGTATVTVHGATGSRGGLFVGYRKYEGPEGFIWIEEWNEGPKAMLGKPEHAENIELWIK